MILLFRSCEVNLSPGSQGYGKENKPRWNGKYKLEILRKCYLSIQAGVTEEDTIYIINDRTTEETLKWMNNNTIAKFYVTDITSLDDLRKNHPYPQYHPVVVNSCPDLTEVIIALATKHPDEIIYVCEDDYLHTTVAISAMKAVFETGYKGFYVPYDYPDRYTLDRTRTADIVAGPYGHLRSVPSATLTVAATGSTWLEYKYDVLRAGVFADDSWTWKAFAQKGGYCPVPGHATHLQEPCITPYVPWSEVYDQIVLEA
jgi:hypothetical protein